MMTYLEIGPDTRIRTEVVPTVDRVEYATVTLTQPQNSVFTTDVGKLSTIITNVQY